MANLYIREYQGGAVFYGSFLGAKEPALNDQVVAIGAGSNQSQPFGPATRVIRVNTDSACSFVIAKSNPVATTSNARMSAESTEYFGIDPGDILAVIANT